MQLVVLLLVMPDLFGDGCTVVGIQLVDQLWDEVLVLQRFLHIQARTGYFSLSRTLDFSIGDIGLGSSLLAFDFLLQD